jgi:hypothetical protein
VSILGLSILLPIYSSGVATDIEGFNLISIANLENKSDSLWATLILAYVFSFVLYYGIFKEYDQYIRISHNFYLKKFAVKNHTVLVTDIPKDLREDSKLREHFTSEHGEGSVKNIVFVRKSKALEESLELREQYFRKWERCIAIKEETGISPQHRPKFIDLLTCKDKVDSISWYESEVSRLNEQIVNLQNQVPSNEQVDKETSSAFVTFSSYSAKIHGLSANALLKKFSAPDEEEVVWKNCSLNQQERSARSLLAGVFLVLLILFYTIPIAFISSLTTLSNIEKAMPALGDFVRSSPVLTGIVEGFLPTLAYMIFLAILPGMLRYMSVQEGRISKSSVERGLFQKYFYFQFIHFFLISIFAASVFGVLNEIVNQPSNALSMLAESLPGYSVFFINFIMLSALSKVPLQFLRIGPLVVGSIKKKYLCKTTYEVEQVETPAEIEIGVEYPMHLLLFIIGLAYSVLTPIILPFMLLYFVVSWMLLQYQLTYVNIPSYESGGALFPRTVSRLLLGALVAQLTIIGYTSLKEATIPAILSAPLPFITAFFFFYIRRRFSTLEKSGAEELATFVQEEGNSEIKLKSYVQKSFLAGPLNISKLNSHSADNSLKVEA